MSSKFARRRRRAVSVAAALLLGSIPLFAVDSIRINEPMVYPDTPAARKILDAAFTRAAAEASELFADVLTVRYARAPRASADRDVTPPAYTIDVIASDTDDGRALVLTMTRVRDGRSTQPANFLGPWGEHLARDIAHSIRYVYQAFSGFDALPLAEPPEYLDEFTGRMISTADLGFSFPVTPTSLAITADGNIIVGASIVAVELDRLYRELGKPGREIYTNDQVSYAYDVGVTAAGTIFARTASGGQVYVIRPDFTRHQRLQTGITSPAVSVALTDGSLVVVDATSRRAVRLEGRVTKPLDLFPTEYSYVYVVAAGPEATLWTWDPLTGSILVYTADGSRIDTIVPLMSHDDRAGVRAMRTLPNGDFVVLSMNALYRFDRRGVPIWRLDGLPSPLSGNFMMVQNMAVDAERGYIYLLSVSDQKVYRLIDRSGGVPVSDLDRAVLELNRRIVADPNDADAYTALARLYEHADAPALAAEMWRTVLDIDPFDSAADAALARTEGLILAAQARQGRDRTIEVLTALGPESARPTYTVAVGLYEQALAKLARDVTAREEVRSELESFRRAFDEFSAPRPRPPSVRVVGFSDIFPSLIRYYDTNPVGSLTVTNDQAEPMHDIVVSVALRFSDFPTESDPVPRLDPGQSAEIPIHLVLSPDVLGLEEDIPVLARFDLAYRIGGQRESTAVTNTVMMRRNTALFWDDSGKLATFITPNDDLVSRFALNVTRAADPTYPALMSDRAWRAALIADAVGAYGVRYIEDPNSPFTEVFGATGVLDTVRFPRTTLRVRSGDCDDTTALLASLFEAAAIKTAIMTSPGHVFLAFDTGEPASNRWLYEGPGRSVVVHDGTVWLPLETTILDRGFVAAWEEASRLVVTHGEIVEFLPLDRQHLVYPPIPLPAASFDIVPPAPQVVANVHTETRGRVNDVLYVAAIAELDRRRVRVDSREAARLGNQTGVLHARHGDLAAAERAFSEVVSVVPEFAPAYVNLANVYRLRGETGKAIAAAETAIELRPRSTAAYIALVQAANAAGNTALTRAAMIDLRAIDEIQAERFSYLVGAADGTRASRAEQPELYAWEYE